MSAIAYWLTWLFVFALPWENAVSVIPGTAIVTKVAGALSLAAALGAMVMSGRLRRLSAASCPFRTNMEQFGSC